MQDVQTLTRFVVPFTMARTRWMLGFQRRFERTWEWLIVTPNDGFLPHTSHTAAMTRYLNRVLRGQVTLAGGPPPGARVGHGAQQADRHRRPRRGGHLLRAHGRRHRRARRAGPRPGREPRQILPPGRAAQSG